MTSSVLRQSNHSKPWKSPLTIYYYKKICLYNLHHSFYSNHLCLYTITSFLFYFVCSLYYCVSTNTLLPFSSISYVLTDMIGSEECSKIHLLEFSCLYIQRNLWIRLVKITFRFSHFLKSATTSTTSSDIGKSCTFQHRFKFLKTKPI